MTVNIKIDVNAKKAFAKIWGLKGNLKQLEGSFDDFDLDVDANIGDNIQELRQLLEGFDGGDMGLLENDMRRARILSSMMDGDFSNLNNINVEGGTGGGVDPPDSDGGGGSSFGFDRHRFFSIPLSRPDLDEVSDDDAMKRLKERWSETFDSIGRSLRRLMPSMRQWWALIAAVLPLLITFATQAIGVASAMGAVAVAGASLIGLGLIGHGDSMAESMSNAREEVSSLAEALYEVFQGTAQTFAPIQAEFFDWAPSQLEGVASAMEGLVAYEGMLYGMWRGLTNWLELGVIGLVNNREQVSQLTARFGELIGSGILEFFSWLLDETYQNQDMLIQLGSAIITVAGIIYNLSKAVSQLLIVYSPLLGLLLEASRIFNNDLVIGMLATIASMYAITTVIVKATSAVVGLVTALGWLTGGGLMAGIVGSLTTISAHVVALTMDLFGLSFAASAALTALTGGLAAIGIVAGGVYMGKRAMDSVNQQPPGFDGAGGGFSGRGRGQQTVIHEGDTNIEVNGSTDRRSIESIRDATRSDRENERYRQGES